MSRADNFAVNDKAVQDFVLGGEITDAEITAGAAQGRKWFSLRRLRLGFACSLTTNGYIALPVWLGGFILQWGFSSNSAAERGVTFPLEFPNACLSGFASLGRDPGAPNAESAAAYSLTKTGMTLFIRDDGVTPVGYWLAIGN
ncbi:gp53-like domain-containing protein [Pseudomonas putida]|uniref:gp53-like domain-containing protein n=1 Tax=Pseudomonas TaxID=286 RepID=UPI0034679CB3